MVWYSSCRCGRWNVNRTMNVGRVLALPLFFTNWECWEVAYRYMWPHYRNEAIEGWRVVLLVDVVSQKTTDFGSRQRALYGDQPPECVRCEMCHAVMPTIAQSDVHYILYCSTWYCTTWEYALRFSVHYVRMYCFLLSEHAKCQLSIESFIVEPGVRFHGTRPFVLKTNVGSGIAWGKRTFLENPEFFALLQNGNPIRWRWSFQKPWHSMYYQPYGWQLKYCSTQ